MLRRDEQPQIMKQRTTIKIAKNFKRKKEKILITSSLIWNLKSIYWQVNVYVKRNINKQP